MDDEKQFHWAVRIANESIEKFGNEQVVCSGWSPSGVYHYGNSKEAITCNAFHRELVRLGASSTFIFVVDDMDPLNKVPYELNEYKRDLMKFVGHPLRYIPDFTETTENYAQYFANGAIEAFERFGFDVKIVYASDFYQEGRYDDILREYMEKEEQVQKVISGITGSPLASLINIKCESCGSISSPVITKVEGETFHYECQSYRQFRGCDHIGSTMLEDHNWKLRWRLDWPARQRFLGVTIEPSGKDHSVQGGSVDTALAIHKEIFERKEPLLERFGFITIKGQKISGSKGNALQARHISDIMPFSAYLFLNYRSDLLKDINFNPSSSEYANLIDDYDRARSALLGLDVTGTDQEIRKLKVAAELAMSPEEKGIIPNNFKYSELILVYQIALKNIDKTIEKLQDKIRDKNGIEELKNRIVTIDHWLDTYAPDTMKYEFLEDNMQDLSDFWDEGIRSVWISTLESVNGDFDESEFTTLLRDTAKSHELTPKEIYPPFYQMLLGENRGPNAASLVKIFGRKKILSRIKEIEI